MSIFLQFDDWQTKSIENTPSDEQVECFECDGSGESLGECECCGHEREGECEECGGDGKISFGSISEYNARTYTFGFHAYIDNMKKDVEAYSEWTGLNKYELYLSAGLTVISHIQSRHESVFKAPEGKTLRRPNPLSVYMGAK